MKTMKRVLTLALALMMIMALALPAMATDDVEEPEEKTYTIKIHGSKSNHVEGSSAGHTYEAYQILSGSMDDSAVNLGNPEWGSNIDAAAFLAALKADTYYGTDAANIFSAVTDARGFASVVAQPTFTTALLEHLATVMDAHLTGTPVDTSTEADAPYQLDVTAGYYLIKDKDGSLDGEGEEFENKDYTDLILHISQHNVDVYHKGSIPTIEKIVSEANSAYYDSIEVAMQREYYYKLIGTLPSDFDDYAEYEYTFVDTMSSGIDFVADTSATNVKGLVSVKAVRNSTGEEVDLNPTSVTYDEANHKLTVYFEDLKHDNNEHGFQPSDKIIIIYKAKLNENAVVGTNGNDNTVHLEYSNNPNGEGTGKTSDDGTKVYTYGLNLTKIDGKSTDPMEGVTFILYREVSETVTKYAQVTSGAITAWVDNEADASVLTTDANGHILIKGLDTNVIYSLLEKETLPAYNKILEPISIYLTAEKEEKDGENVVTTVWMEENTHTNNLDNYVVDGDVVGVQFDVPNYMGEVLPSTGGMGTTIFYILGSVLVLGAALLLITKKRMA